jgi:hypothetical protein
MLVSLGVDFNNPASGRGNRATHCTDATADQCAGSDIAVGHGRNPRAGACSQQAAGHGASPRVIAAGGKTKVQTK